jgi:hypothetical protein
VSEPRPLTLAQAQTAEPRPPTLAPATTQAITLQPLPLPKEAPQIAVNAETAGGLGLIVSTLVGGIMWLRKRHSRDGVALQEDRNNTEILKTSLSERNQMAADMREAILRTAGDARVIGQLTAENDYLKRELAEARATITEIRNSVQIVGKKVDAFQGALVQTARNVAIPPRGTYESGFDRLPTDFHDIDQLHHRSPPQ